MTKAETARKDCSVTALYPHFLCKEGLPHPEIIQSIGSCGGVGGGEGGVGGGGGPGGPDEEMGDGSG